MRTPPRPSVRLAGMAGNDPADEIAALTSTLDSVEAVLDPGEMQREAADLREQSADPELWADPDRGQKVTRRLSYLEAELTRLTGQYDSREALISINAQAGGADAADFAENLMRMYLRWAERHKYPTEVYDTSYAEEAGIKSTTFAV